MSAEYFSYKGKTDTLAGHCRRLGITANGFYQFRQKHKLDKMSKAYVLAKFMACFRQPPKPITWRGKTQSLVKHCIDIGVTKSSFYRFREEFELENMTHAEILEIYAARHQAITRRKIELQAMRAAGMTNYQIYCRA